MWKIIQPPSIYFDTGAAREYNYPPNSLVITTKGAISRGWIDYMFAIKQPMNFLASKGINKKYRRLKK